MLAGVVGKSRVYYVAGDNPAKLREIKDWAATWGGRGSGTYSGYGGELAMVTAGSNGTLGFATGERFEPLKGHITVVVTDRPMTPRTLILRILTIFR